MYPCIGKAKKREGEPGIEEQRGEGDGEIGRRRKWGDQGRQSKGPRSCKNMCWLFPFHFTKPKSIEQSPDITCRDICLIMSQRQWLANWICHSLCPSSVLRKRLFDYQSWTLWILLELMKHLEYKQHIEEKVQSL